MSNIDLKILSKIPKKYHDKISWLRDEQKDGSGSVCKYRLSVKEGYVIGEDEGQAIWCDSISEIKWYLTHTLK